MMPICGCAYPDHQDDDEPWPFVEALQNQRCAIGFLVAPTLDCVPVFLRAFDYDYEYVVVFVQRFPATRRANAGAGQKRVW